MKKEVFIIKLFPVIVLCSVTCFCNREVDTISEPPPQIYKLKGDYIDNVCVGLSEDKTEIRVYPGTKDNCGDPNESPIKVDSGYYLDDCCNYGVNSAYLSIRKEDYSNHIPRDSLYKMILDKNPYEEYYIDEDRILVKICTDCFTLDTVLLNDIISEGSLADYFKKIL